MTRTRAEEVDEYVNSIADADLRKTMRELALENLRLRDILEAVQGAYGELAGRVEVTQEYSGGKLCLDLTACCQGDERALAKAFADRLGEIMGCTFSQGEIELRGTSAMKGRGS